MAENQRIITIRNYFNLKQKDFSIELGISQSKISKVESGEQKMNAEIIGAILERFKVNAEWLLGKIGSDDKIIFSGDFVPKSQYEELKEQNSELKDKLLEYMQKENEQLKFQNKEGLPSTTKA